MADRLLFFTREFQEQIKRLAKRYSHIREDVEPVLAQLKAGDTPGDQIKGTKHRVYKVRIRNQDAQRGKSGGYRLIYYLRIETQVILLTLYSKSDQSDVETREIERILRSWTDDNN